MAARSLTLGPRGEEMAISENTRTILEAIRSSEQATNKALGDVNVTVAGLRSDVANVQLNLGNLDKKVDKIDQLKAEREDLKAVEERFRQTVAEMKAQTIRDISQIDKDKIGKSEFSVDTFDNVEERLNEIDKKLEGINLSEINRKIEALNEFKWRSLGRDGVLVAIASFIGGFLMWMLRAALSK